MTRIRFYPLGGSDQIELEVVHPAVTVSVEIDVSQAREVLDDLRCALQVMEANRDT
jgi:hypothetical protein